jgi:hypothetical protein
MEETKSTYTPAVKKAIDKYRSKNIEKYNEYQRNRYHQAKTDEEWKETFNKRCRDYNKKYREKKNLANPPKPRGRPKKAIPVINTSSIPMPMTMTIY